MEDSSVTYEQLNDLSAEFDDAETELSKSRQHNRPRNDTPRNEQEYLP